MKKWKNYLNKNNKMILMFQARLSKKLKTQMKSKTYLLEKKMFNFQKMYNLKKDKTFHSLKRIKINKNPSLQKKNNMTMIQQNLMNTKMMKIMKSKKTSMGMRTNLNKQIRSFKKDKKKYHFSR